MPAVSDPRALVFDDLRAEQERLESVLDALDDDSWASESGAPGWSVADVVLHLAISEELVVATLAVGDPTVGLERGASSMDEAMDAMVQAQRAEPAAVFARWREGRRRALEALSAADPERPVAWAAAPLRPATLATTRLAEHWAHGLDITAPLGIDFDDTQRLRHVAWLAHRSLPYAFALAGLPAAEVRCVLIGPGGDPWEFGPEDGPSTLEGPAGEFCRVAARRLRPEDTRLVASGPAGARALALVRTYAA